MDEDRSESARRWLLDVSSRSLSADALFAGVCDRLRASGVLLWRANTSLLTKHPEVFVRNVEWYEDRGCEVYERTHQIVDSPIYLDSPVARVHGEGASIRCRLSGPDADLRYPICRDLAAQGATDYVVAPVVFGDGQKSFLSWATKRDTGFDDADLRALADVKDLLALRLEVYLGHNAAERVLAGAFKRGGGETIRAAIWFCDMRGFTAFADRAPAADVVQTLDRFFESVASPIGARGGDILKFIGDAVLAIFPVDDDAAEVCTNALAAAEDALLAVDALNRDRDAPIGVGIALHLGDVMYGNIGARDRLDFTVIGAAVNEVTRVESMCKTLGARLLMTSRFAEHCARDRVKSLGHHALRGVREPQEIFTVHSGA